MSAHYKAVSGASAGNYHEMMNIPCQDSVCIKRNGDTIVAVLADGAGSVQNSEIISSAVTERISDLFICRLNELLEMPDEALRKKIADEAEYAVRQKNKNMDAHCTLLAFAAQEGNRTIVHCGDGIIFGFGHNGAQVISKPENGETLSQTFFLSTPNPVRHIRIYREVDSSFTSFLLCSDGLESILYNRKDNEPAKAAVNMMNWISVGSEDEAQQMLDTAMSGILKQHTTDDISAILIGEEKYADYE